MSSNLRVLRLIVWIALALCIAWFLAVRFLWTRPAAPPDFAALALQGQPLVAAIEQYHQDHDLWPEFLEDLTPHYLPQRADPEWIYEPGLSLIHQASDDLQFVRFDFDPAIDGGLGWKKINRDWEASPLNVPAPSIAATTLPAEKIKSAALAELDRRIARTSGRDVIDQYRRKAAWLLRHNSPDDAAKTISQAATAMPDHYWPPLAAAVLSEEPALVPPTLASTTQASAPASAPATSPSTSLHPAQALIAWTRANPSFTHYFYLAYYYRVRGNSAGIAAALAQAAKYPLEIDVDDPMPPDAYAFESCRMAYNAGDPVVVLALAQRWEARSTDSPGQLDTSFIAFRAAAELSQGNFPRAQEHAAAAVEQSQKAPMWAENLDALKTAADQQDKNFQWNPGRKLAPFDAFAP